MKKEKPNPITITPDRMGKDDPAFIWAHKTAKKHKMKSAAFMKMVMNEAYERSGKSKKLTIDKTGIKK